MLGVATWAGLLLVAAASGEAPDPSDLAPKLFGLVVGSNTSRDPDVAPLRYADDDAVKNGALLSELGADVVLLVDLDEESRELYPELSPPSPNRASLSAALGRLNDRMQEERRRGRRSILYLFYSGHGDVENNQGYVTLKDEQFWRDDLLALLRQSRADENHVIIDACKSYFLVYSKGSEGERAPLSGSLIGHEETLPANTGVFLSTSSANDSHEWEAFQAGVFSHEIRSALRGAADQDLDDRITYEEAGAFVWSANRAIPNRRYRPNFMARPPAGRSAMSVLLDLSASRSNRLEVPSGTDRHVYVEDARGVRIADFHPGSGQAVVLHLPPRRPLFFRHSRSNEEVEIPAGERLRLVDLPRRRATVQRRGAEHEAFRALFEGAFDGSSLAHYRTLSPAKIIGRPLEPNNHNWLRTGLGITALAAGTAGGVLSVLAVNERKGVLADETSGVNREDANARLRRFNVATVLCFTAAGAAAVAYLTWSLWPTSEDVELGVAPAVDSHGVSAWVRF